ncbi:hypothetical protein, partial [Ruminococcus sp.]|uniref:hypothetical protein n=1 Tax=Ruminococcus sp. TaxID=41978 RepID=UPI003868A9DA
KSLSHFLAMILIFGVSPKAGCSFTETKTEPSPTKAKILSHLWRDFLLCILQYSFFNLQFSVSSHGIF